MYTLYSENTSAFSLLHDIREDKCIALKKKSYRFYVYADTLYLDITSVNSNISRRTLEVEKNVKADFNIHIQDDHIHIILANKSYDLIYRLFDGHSFTREIICGFDSETGIPSNPVIKTLNNHIHIVVSFIKIKRAREWSLCSIIREQGKWKIKRIDKGFGLCYTQHCTCLDSSSNLHLVYKKYDHVSQNIKYAFFDGHHLRWSKPKIICDNGTNKYNPFLFINTMARMFILWLEISDQIYLCVADINSGGNYAKIVITSTIHHITVWNDLNHIYAMSCEENNLFYDLCCLDKKSLKTGSQLYEEGSEKDMDIAKIRLFLDIKRELEQRISELENQLDTTNKQLENSEKRIIELTSMVNRLICEKKLFLAQQSQDVEISSDITANANADK